MNNNWCCFNQVTPIKIHASGVGRDHDQTKSGRPRRLKFWVAGRSKTVLAFLHNLVVDPVRSVGYFISSAPSLLDRQF